MSPMVAAKSFLWSAFMCEAVNTGKELISE